jgi:hypothetical protein
MRLNDNRRDRIGSKDQGRQAHEYQDGEQATDWIPHPHFYYKVLRNLLWVKWYLNNGVKPVGSTLNIDDVVAQLAVDRCHGRLSSTSCFLYHCEFGCIRSPELRPSLKC